MEEESVAIEVTPNLQVGRFRQGLKNSKKRMSIKLWGQGLGRKLK
jgi:hypothetical protein